MSLDRPEVFGELYARHFAAIYRYVAGRLGPDAADDLAAETFLAAFRRRHRFDPARGAVRPWLESVWSRLKRSLADYFSVADESDNARGTSRPTRQEILVQIIRPPRVEQRPEKTYLGIRVVTPFRGMLRVRDELLAELYMWLASHDIEPTGPFFLRLHVIDMEGPMDLEVGVITTTELEGDDRVRPGVLPAGGYATLTYVDHARRANKALIEWARDNGVAFDRWDEPSGDAFACRYEAYITDPRTEPRKTKWEVELNMRVA